MAAEFIQKLHKEIAETQLRRHKLDILKIAFITTLLGFGSLKLRDLSSFYPLLYLVPLVGVFFDLLIMGEHYSIRRIGVFIRLKSEDKLEKQFERYVSRKRDKFFKNGSRCFTVLSILAAMVILFSIKGQLLWIDYVWFGLILIGYFVIIIFGNQQLKDLDKLTAKELDELIKNDT